MLPSRSTLTEGWRCVGVIWLVVCNNAIPRDINAAAAINVDDYATAPTACAAEAPSVT